MPSWTTTCAIRSKADAATSALYAAAGPRSLHLQNSRWRGVGEPAWGILGCDQDTACHGQHVGGRGRVLPAELNEHGTAALGGDGLTVLRGDDAHVAVGAPAHENEV